MTKEIDFSQNYCGPLRRAAKGDRRELVKQLRSGVPPTRTDLTMLADLLEGRLQPKGRAGRPKLSRLSILMSDHPMHRAVAELWWTEAYGTPEAARIAEAFGVDLESLSRSFRRHRRCLGLLPGQKPTPETVRSVRD